MELRLLAPWKKFQGRLTTYFHGNLSKALQGFQPRMCEDGGVHWLTWQSTTHQLETNGAYRHAEQFRLLSSAPPHAGLVRALGQGCQQTIPALD